jgi:hypothetical protein
MRIREEGLTVLGFGEQKTPEAFKNACHKFVFTEVLRPTLPKIAGSGVQATETTPKVAAKTKNKAVPKGKPSFPKQFVIDALEQSSDEDGWAHLGTFGSYLTKLQPDFDSRNFGFKKLSDLVKAKTDLFVSEERNIPGSNQKQLYVRAK